MDENRKWYEQMRASFLEIVAEILAALSKVEPGFSELRPKDCMFRQNRDIRFSANKAPYKTNMAAYFSIGGKKADGPGYYLHVQPGASMVGGGVWMPQAPVLKKIKDTFGVMQGEKLKTSPKGFEKDHPYIEYLRYKSFVLSRAISDKDIRSGAYVALALEAYEKMRPFQAFLARAIYSTEEEDLLL